MEVDALKATANKCIAKGELTQALAALGAALGTEPHMPVLWANRAYVYELQHEHEKALSDAQQCLQFAPDFSKGHLRAGRALTSLGRLAEARELLASASARFPQDYALVEALNAVGDGGVGGSDV
eukprot:CAMPEP_0183338396 /NCGR_PEP_ID=MMETSP0164_2-20130417/5710_1 /TAXON_ID=221442 /ORGANISM="Coccolithus pelagicus ssp braarudi, Strain PLY182g" /LENGTH=124 /DNA_ID=CAMNT_0025508243 /DNA_START=11 /DNA_END=382 /DNA_ORIENTATION=-